MLVLSPYSGWGFPDAAVRQNMSYRNIISCARIRERQSWNRASSQLDILAPQAAPDLNSSLRGHVGIHPQVWEKCEELYEAGAFAEAVEKSFKVVRDQLRALTGGGICPS